ncbi:hypothetical protein SRABI27_01043 [Pedobacter sp. Bi27]|uniref:hypothetical protein n=1 Tax=unclassified Pedobacter TaxID=2628915 RepID=UPI001DB68919|nr:MULTISPECIES: hypothetical protein [unclassified Pedobacter]CAH0171876.1 hypothetical protein SRABI126_01048 [Pedobacter sp. Bi126]CAH0172119.1 hypothetical protein SRABI27_01043 [Pedobacter sp. Bi27]CAH0289291.1 hypothetical protein SRABI36_04258 [Pedobacter sp. Bi36]
MSLSQIDLRTRYQHKHAPIFNTQSWCISELYWSFLKNYDVGKVKKCFIQVSDDWGDEVNKYTNWNDCKGINMSFAFEEYFDKSDYHKKEMLLEIVHRGMMAIAGKEGWDSDPLLDAFNSCRAANLDYSFLVQGKFKNSPSRKYKFGLWCEWGLNELKVFWILKDRNEEEIKRVLLINESLAKGESVYYFTYKWMDNETVVVTDDYSNVNRLWKIDINI